MSLTLIEILLDNYVVEGRETPSKRLIAQNISGETLLYFSFEDVRQGNWTGAHKKELSSNKSRL
jgi:hypothetical protein